MRPSRSIRLAALSAALVLAACGGATPLPSAVPPVPSPVGPISQAQALAMGLSIGRAWGEPSPLVIGAAQSSTSDWLAQLKAHGEYINMPASGDVWLVRLSGHFTPDRRPPGPSIHCQKMAVVIAVASGDVISAGCE